MSLDVKSIEQSSNLLLSSPCANRAILTYCENWFKQVKTNPSTTFWTFDWDQSAKTRQHEWKERLKISEVAKFERDCWKLMNIFLPKVAKFYKLLYEWQVRTPTLRMSVKFSDLMEQYLRSP